MSGGEEDELSEEELRGNKWLEVGAVCGNKMWTTSCLIDSLVFVGDESVESVLNSALILSHPQQCPRWSTKWHEEKTVWERNHDGIPLRMWLWWHTCK